MEIVTTILIIIGSITVAIVCIALGALLLWVMRMYRYSRQMAGVLPEMLQGMASMRQQPVRIHLRPAHEEWGAVARVSAAATQLEQLGYTRAGVYMCGEIPGLRLLALINEAERLTAVIYEMDPVGVWVDVVARRNDGGSLTCTTSSHVGMLEQRPGHAKHSEPLRDGAHLHHLATTGVSLEQRLPVTNQGFVADCERAYADEMDWRASLGGPNDGEMERVRDRYQINLEDKVAKQAMRALQDQSRRQLQNSLRARLLESTHLSAQEWEQVRERLVFTHDRMTSAEVKELISTYTDEIPEYTSDAPARELFQELNRLLSPAHRFRHLASLQGVLFADAWETPAEN